MAAPHTRVAAVFLEARSLGDDRRAQFLDQACVANATLRAEVEELLGWDRTRAPFDTPIDIRWDAVHTGADGPPVPTRIGPYDIVNVLGTGGMGTVYRARQSNPARDVALKVMRPGLTTPSLARRFAIEADALGRLQHAGIAQIYEAGTADDGHGPQPFFAMELVEGDVLTRYAERQRLDTRARLELLAKIARAVHHAHQKGVVHRDLKPSNILVTAAGEPKILDFGVARVTDADVEAVTRQTDAGQLIGTLPYMSPEQVAGTPDAIDIRSDVYALGVIGYELLVGVLPIDIRGKPLPEAARTIQEDVPTRLSSVARTYRGDIDTIIAKALEKERQRRYQSADELADDVERFLKHETISARPPTLGYQAAVFARRHKGLVAGLAGVVIALAGGTVTSTALYLKAEDQRIEAELKRGEAETARAAEERARNAADAARVEAERQSKIAQSVNRYLTHDLIASVSPSSNPTMREVVEAAAASLDERFPDDPAIEGSVRAAIGRTFKRLGDYEKAEQHLRASVDGLIASLGPEHLETVLAMNNLGLLYVNQRRHTEAKALLEPAVEVAERDLPADHPEMPTLLMNLGAAYSGLGEFAEAMPVLERALELVLALFGEDSVETSRAMANLASAAGRAGDRDRARELFEKCLAIDRSLFGDDHSETITDLNNLGGFYLDEGDYDRARPMLEEAVARGRRVFGDRHPLQLRMRGNLASMYSELGEDARAVAIYEELVEISRDSLGPDAAMTHSLMNNLAGTYADLDRHDEAEAAYVAVLESRRRTLGEDHVQTLLSANNLGAHYRKQGDLDRAEPLLTNASAGFEQRLGPDHRRTLSAKSNLGALLADRGRYDEAASLLSGLLPPTLEAWPADHWYPALVRARLGVALTGQRRFKDAKRELLQAHDILDAALGTDHDRTVQCRGHIVSLYETWGQPDAAAQWRERGSAPR
ncbi:MAG: tetratricopeptide repeat protein [Planctomycetota bacterium]